MSLRRETVSAILGLGAWLFLVAAAPGLAQSPERGRGLLEVFVAEGCPHCAAAKVWLRELRGTRPDLTIAIYEVTQDTVARQRLLRLADEHGRDRVAVPTFLVGDSLLVGWQDAATTGRTLLTLLPAGAETPPVAAATPSAGSEVVLPVFGAVSAGRLGLPLFTIAVGLVDGFNPCAMWALLLILGILVRLEDRRRMLAIAGTFVAVAGAVYFVFLAAWLEFFLLVGFSRVVQLVLGGTALVIGALNLKDAVAFGRGPSLSVPESLKPGIYARIRQVLTAPTLPLALVAVAVLSFAVNLVEVICTAGLPAVYTHVLGSMDLARPAYYGYLLLYVAAYIFDDSVMLAIATITLTRTRMQERAGRWLKLVSGVVMLALGLLLIFRPSWLVAVG